MNFKRSIDFSKLQPINHPWLLSSSPQRRIQNSFLGILKEKIIKAAALSRTKGIIPGYDFPRQFLDEAAVVAGQVFQILSDKEKQTHALELSQVMTKLLADAFAKGNQELRDKDHVPIWILHGKPKLSILGIHMTIGPHPQPEGYVLQHMLPFVSAVVPKEDVNFISHQQQVAVIEDAKKDGIFLRINVRLMNNIDFVCLKKDNEVFKDTRNYVDLEFMSPHFTPWDKVQYLDADGEWHLNWKLSDVDFFLQCQMM